mmetsp:Transcript_13900/g.24474  ORF Transcript_13900/g.24474 Transcript_13900/m.24474 type:complete len:233 (-) Transcript_13900:2903-3601(-)
MVPPMPSMSSLEPSLESPEPGLLDPGDFGERVRSLFGLFSAFLRRGVASSSSASAPSSTIFRAFFLSCAFFLPGVFGESISPSSSEARLSMVLPISSSDFCFFPPFFPLPPLVSTTTSPSPITCESAASMAPSSGSGSLSSFFGFFFLPFFPDGESSSETGLVGEAGSSASFSSSFFLNVSLRSTSPGLRVGSFIPRCSLSSHVSAEKTWTPPAGGILPFRTSVPVAGCLVR